jgi:uncharacterized membrane protein YqjE
MTGLRGSLHSLGSTLLELVCARAELAAIELQEERQRAVRNLALAAVSVLFVAAGILLTALLVVVFFWDTHRALAAGSMALLFLSIGVLALLRLRVLVRTAPLPFAGTMDEFSKDLDLLRGRRE